MNGILIAEAGSTKTNWSLLTSKYEGIKRFSTKGINPAIQSESEVLTVISEASNHYKNYKISNIHYFGAGCIDKELKNLIRNKLRLFGEQADIEVQSDLLGAARSLFGDSEGIACILGTGSNSCIYKNNRIVEKIPSLGYVLGDEGSGASLGKKLLNYIFKKQLSPSIINQFKAEYNLTLEDMIRKVYREPRPAAYLASFSSFLHKNLKESEIYDLVFEEFDSFIKKNVVNYPDYKNMMVGFVGSVAHYYSDILNAIAKKHDIQIVKIERDPMPSLEIYYSHR